MSRSIYGRIQLESGYVSETWIEVDDTGYAFVEEKGRWYPLSSVLWIEPDEDGKSQNFRD